MLKTIDLIKDVDEKYIPMLKMVKIPEFVKCIAQFSGLAINEVKDEVIKSYLLTWAENKYRYFEMLGNKLQLDIPFKYHSQKEERRDNIEMLQKEFPAYFYWIDEFTNSQKSNKVIAFDLGYSMRDKIRKFFPELNIDGTTITHFFKKYLKAPDELVTKIGALYENETVEATFTMSIDPVDFMTSSENPYNWTSCYRLELDRDDSHADGCLAAALDTPSMVTYVWTNHGKLKLYDNFELKDVRYKRMRMTIAISDHMTTVHFNDIYPGRDNYEKDFQKQIRNMVEKVVANFIGKEDKWVKDENVSVERMYAYGYNEYSDYKVWKIKETDDNVLRVFDTVIKSPDGYGNLPGTDWGNVCSNVTGWDDLDEVRYNGEGFICSNFYDEYFCEYSDDYCDCGGDNCECEDCPYWRDAHPLCSLTVDPELEDFFGGEDECPREDGNPDVDDGIADACANDCKNCPKWKEHKEWLKENDPELYKERFGDDEEEKKSEIDSVTIHYLTGEGLSILDNSAVSTTISWPDMAASGVVSIAPEEIQISNAVNYNDYLRVDDAQIDRNMWGLYARNINGDWNQITGTDTSNN